MAGKISSASEDHLAGRDIPIHECPVKGGHSFKKHNSEKGKLSQGKILPQKEALLQKNYPIEEGYSLFRGNSANTGHLTGKHQPRERSALEEKPPNIGGSASSERQNLGA